MQFKPEIAATGLEAAFWLACAFKVASLWVRTRGNPNGARSMLVAMSHLCAIRGGELVYVAIVWNVPLVHRQADANLEHLIRLGYILLNAAGIAAIWHLAVVWSRPGGRYDHA